MTNKPKSQGTRFETHLVNHFIDRGLEATRLPEGGSKDEGDIIIYGTIPFVVEAKARANLNVHQALAKAKEKSNTWTVVIWKKLTRKDGNKRRTPDGEPIIVAMDLDTFTRLIS